MGKIDYQKIYNSKRDGWKEATEPGNKKFENFFAGQYSENNHFVYELLQNAEDAEATFITFVYRPNRLIIYHNGRPFNEKDVNGICSVMESGKDKDSLQTIGHFGIGFKSVFKYTDQPEIYSNSEAFAIENYLLPMELPCGDFPRDCCYQKGDETVFPFENEHNATKFILPFKKDLDASGIDPRDVIKKLSSLEDEILLFLRHIRNLTWVDETTGKYGEYECEQEHKDEKIYICRKSDGAGEKQERRYLVYARSFPAEEMKNAFVKIAFKVSPRRIEPVDSARIWVFFPTTDESGLKFLAHGTYQTPISREKIVLDSTFNRQLFQCTEDLVIEALADLRERRLLTQAFLKEILLPSFSSAYMRELKKKATEAFEQKPLLPTYKSSAYYCAREMRLAIPYNLPELVSEGQLSDAIGERASFVAFSDINAFGSGDYYHWLVNDLKLTKWTLVDFAELLSNENLDEFGGYTRIFKLLMGLDAESNLSGEYGRDLKMSLRHKMGSKSAWDILRHKPILPNQGGTISAAWINEKPNLYLRAKAEKESLPAEKYVDISALLMQGQEEPTAKPAGEDDQYKKCEKFLKNNEYFCLEVYDHKQYVKEEICHKYEIGNPSVTDEEHIKDIRQIFSLRPQDMQDMELGCYYFIRAVNGENKVKYCYPKDENLYIDNQLGISLKSYYKGISSKYFVDLDFYQLHGIEVENFKNVNIRDSIVKGLERKGTCDQLPIINLDGRSSWKCEGNFRCKLELESMGSVLSYIRRNWNSENTGNAREKSKIIFKLLQQNGEKLHGEICLSNGTSKELDCAAIRYIKDSRIPWLFTKDNRLVSSMDVSQCDLDRQLYEELPYGSPLFKCLKFKMDSRDRKKNLAELMYNYSDDALRDFVQAGIGELRRRGEHEEGVTPYNEDWEFPRKRIHDLNRLRRHVQEGFACAELVQYHRVPRSIRITQRNIDQRSYLKDNYEEKGRYACQLCHESCDNFEAVEIEKEPKRELEQMHLCLCPNCARKYKTLREDSACIEQMKERIRAWTIESVADIQLNDKLTLWFAPVHLAEVQTLLECMEEESEEICIEPLDMEGNKAVFKALGVE